MSDLAFLARPDSRLLLQDSTAALTNGCRDLRVEDEIAQIMDQAVGSADILREIQDVMERMRSIPGGTGRIATMNSFVRALGEPERLAKLLDVLRISLTSTSPDERKFADDSQGEEMHCVYGWAGQTLMLESHQHDVEGTTPPRPGVTDFFPHPVAVWHISIHIWQANPNAHAFEATKNIDSDSITEPPHTHPFPFVSYVSVGEMHQSTYAEQDVDTVQSETDRYEGVLERVDGAWPPHEEYTPSRLRTVEHRFHLKAGDSYYMPTDVVHDVEVSKTVSANTPAITLFLAGEFTDIPHAYMSSPLAQFHRENPDILELAQPLDPEEWSAKLAATAQYLRGEVDHLRLHEIFDCKTSYGFMHKRHD